MLDIIIALIPVLAAIVPLVVEHIQKRLRSTPADESAAARAAEIATLPGAIERLERSGDFASADVFRRRLRDLTTPERGGDGAG
ncbi:hypothetical protein OH491_13605 [Termitidicoccus mucosus]|uniref:Uncharacterized protein n=1 Tax=Termitidicoccus mucosus TaxID=1184151 RepID=A0A178IJH0_9BACT|nr:hypothetical protein AW736_13845 [Opitutaceae bacterium TSB47]